MSVRAKVIELMQDLRRELGLTYVYITHDLATAKFFCDRIAIMYLGRIVELGPTEEIFANPRHPYTRSLLAAVPEPDPRVEVSREVPRGEVPDAAIRPAGCSFHPRCPKAFEVCGWEGRDLRALLEERWTTLTEDDYLTESSLFADLSALDGQRGAVRVTAASGHTGEEVAARLGRIRDADPEEPLWRGVADIHAESGHAEITFREGTDPGLTLINDVQVACHLHDPSLEQKPA
jgi:peptide/nickel transport system ATP-binding protein